MARVQSLAQKLPHTLGVAKKTKQNKKRRRSPALPETPFLLLLISVLDFLPKLTNTQTSHTRDSFCLLLNYINIKLNNMICLWDLFSLFHFAGSLHFHAVWYSNIWIYHNLFTKHLGAFFVSAVRSNDFYVFFFFCSLVPTFLVDYVAERNCQVIWQECLQLLWSCHTFFTKWSHHLTLPLVMHEFPLRSVLANTWYWDSFTIWITEWVCGDVNG